MATKLRIAFPTPPPSDQIIDRELKITVNGSEGGAQVLPVSQPHFDVNSPSGIYSARIRNRNVAGYSSWSGQAAGPGLPTTPEPPTITTVDE